MELWPWESSYVSSLPLAADRSCRSNELFIHIPERVRIENSRTEIADCGLSANENVWAQEENERQILRNEFLHAVVQFFASGVVGRRHLRFHQLVELSFPWSRRGFLAHIPQMHFAVGTPETHFRCRINVAVDEIHEDGVVVVRIHDAIDESAKFEWDYFDVDTELLQVVLGDGGDFGSLRV